MARIFLSALMLVITSTFALAQSGYRIQPGDVLEIEVLEDPSLNRSALVLPDGRISFPLIGGVQASGRSVSTVQTAIASALAPNFAAAPNVFVAINSLSTSRSGFAPKTIDVYVMGEVNNPGKVSVKSGTSLLQFLAESGGLTKFAATKRIQLRRTNSKTGKAVVYGFNYRAIERGAASASSIVLRKGDVIVVPERRLFE
ncbi:MAG: polysaccharide biosynthesis/export family protein [Marinosulfonomonas sp.]|nr:polysaccharide biosynthesis/export family protein [Marinosulfonomonas sp.]